MPFRILSLLLSLLMAGPMNWPAFALTRSPAHFATAVSPGPTSTLANGVAAARAWCGYDGHGSTRFLMNGSTVVNVFAYDAYGTLIASNTAAQTAYLYAGEQGDANLGLYYNRARYLNPAIGRFHTMDSYEGTQTDPLSLHKYLYAHANPVMMTDPSGHFSLGEINVVGAIRTTLFMMNTVGAISNAKQTARYSVSAFEAISDDDPWNATLSIAGAVMHGGLTAMNVLGMKSFMASIGPPPAASFALAGGGAVGAGRVWQFALSNPAAKKWVFEEFVPVVGGGLGLFASHMGHEAEWEHRDSGGKITTRGNSESGSDVPPGPRLNWNEQLKTHTEYKILSELSGTTQPGDIITIRGSLPPCNPGRRGCQAVMDEFSRVNQVKIIYKAGGQVWVY